MAGLTIDTALCTGCGRCLRSCSTGGLAWVGEGRERRVQPTDQCIACGICVESCRRGAISLVREKAEAGEHAAWLQPDECHDVWVFAQADDGELAPVALELAGKGRELANARGVRLVALLGAGEDVCAAGDPYAPSAAEAPAGAPSASTPAASPASAPSASTPAAFAASTSDALARALIAAGADEVIRCRDARLAWHDPEAFALWICGLVRERKPEILLMGATGFGRELAPAVAVRLQTGLTADCTVLEMDAPSGLLHQTRPAFGGNLMATITCPDRRPQMSTVRPGVFSAPQSDPARTGIVTDVALPALPSPRVQVVQAAVPSNSDSITDAEVLVVVGRGIGSQKNLPLMRRLAELLGGKLGCSRPLVEMGWCDYACQVGQTGVSVAPKVLVSVGVSGAIQHLAGISGAQTVIAINEDPAAPIFGASTYSVVGDCVEVVAELVAQLESAAAAERE